MRSPRRPRTIPADAIETPPTHDGAFHRYHRNGVPIALASYHPSGRIEHLIPLDADNRQHGIERGYDARGRLIERARWHHGLQHGLQQQWDDAGKLLTQTRFHRGTGTDLWYDRGHLSESRTFVRGLNHGPDRWWSEDGTVWHELPFDRGTLHGIERMWNDQHRLRRGYPRFWIRGERTTRAAYLRACKRDLSLPVYDARDDAPQRPSPLTP